MSVSNVFAGVAVKDFELVVAWYARLLERPADSRPMPNLAEWKFSEGGLLQVFNDEDRAGASSVTLAVTDLDEQVAKLVSKGIEIGPTTSSSFVKTAIIKDPSGNQIVFAQPVKAA
jgi:predicted enzyme related to lactoylglutathione lyase